jgi:HSP20 family protein
LCTENSQHADGSGVILAARLAADPLLKRSSASANRRQSRVARRFPKERLMTIVRYEPWGLVNRFNRDYSQLFNRFFREDEPTAASAVAWLPSVDVREETERFVVQVDLPGVESKDIEITAEKGVLTLKGERKSETKKNDSGYERVERVAGTFLRRFTLPESANAEGITAKQTNGVLEVTIPKQAKAQPKRIEVQAA